MQMNWRDLLAMHWPVLLFLAISIVSAIFTLGFEQGKRAMLFAAVKSAAEAKTGVMYGD